VAKVIRREFGIRYHPIEFRLMKPHPWGFSCYRAHVYVIERHLLPGALIPGSFFSTD